MASRASAPKPSIVLVWDPMEVARWQQLDELDGWWLAGTVSDTNPGERAAVYQTSRDKGIVGFFDFATPAFLHPDLRWSATGRPVPLAEAIPRSKLTQADGFTDQLARSVFERPDVQLWMCQRSAAGSPRLVEITRRRPMPS
jgi:hypothetical protein